MSRLKAVLFVVAFLALPLVAIAQVVPPWEPGCSPEEIDARARDRRYAESARKQEIEDAPIRQARATESLRKEIAELRDEMRLIRQLLERLLEK